MSKSSTRSTCRRNPFYFKVDPEGNQLPCIHCLEVQKVESKEMMAAKASAGQVTLAGRQLMTADISLFKRFEAENIWAIGVAGLAPHPVIVRDDLKNVPRDGYWGWDSRWSYPCYPETWYLEPNAG